MNHLSPEEFVDALDGAGAARVSAHLAECEACRTELSEMRAVVDGAETLEAAEPSPLFWDHFSARVKEATARETASMPGGWSWGAFAWKPAAAILVAAAALVIGLNMRPAAPAGDPGFLVADGKADVAPVPLLEDDGTWSLMTALAADMEWDQVSEAVSPVAGTSDVLIEALTPSQREALARLLEKEMGEL